jgi:ParB-like chromosome segregation protein Spo0J
MYIPLAIVYVPIDDLKPDPKNARLHSKKQIKQIAESIKSFGFNVPLLVDADFNVVAGHGRLLACKHLGWTEIPTIRLDHLSEAQRRAFTIADNRLTEIASWDDRLLAEQLKELASFDTGEIDLRIESLAAEPNEPKEAPIPAASGPAVSQEGDLWLLGSGVLRQRARGGLLSGRDGI